MLEESRSLPLITSQKSCLLQAGFSLNIVFIVRTLGQFFSTTLSKKAKKYPWCTILILIFSTLHIKVTNEHDSSSFISIELNALTRQLLLQMHECVTSTDLYKSITEGPENTNWFPKWLIIGIITIPAVSLLLCKAVWWTHETWSPYCENLCRRILSLSGHEWHRVPPENWKRKEREDKRKIRAEAIKIREEETREEGKYNTVVNSRETQDENDKVEKWNIGACSLTTVHPYWFIIGEMPRALFLLA